jgi:hypothetical protein
MVFKFSFKWFIRLSYEDFQTKSIVSKKFNQKDFLQSTFIQKGLQKFIKSLPNWIRIPTSIHFPSLCCHQGISIPRKALKIESYLRFTPSTQVLLLMCQGHTFMWNTVDVSIHISSPYNQPIISGSTIHHSFPPHSIAFKRSFIHSTDSSIQPLSPSQPHSQWSNQPNTSSILH